MGRSSIRMAGNDATEHPPPEEVPAPPFSEASKVIGSLIELSSVSFKMITLVKFSVLPFIELPKNRIFNKISVSISIS